MSYAEHIADFTHDAVVGDKHVIVMGAGVTDQKGIFGTTLKAAQARPKQVIETPLSELMLTGSLVGLAQTGFRPIFVHARSDFMTLSAEHLVNTIAKWQYMGGHNLPIMVRCIIGQGWGNGPQHTQSFAHWFASIPGLNVFTPHSKEGLDKAFAMWANGYPTVVFEHRALYGLNLMPSVPAKDAHVVLVGTSGSMVNVYQASYILRAHGIRASVHGIEAWPVRWPVHTKNAPVVAVDIAPERLGLMQSVDFASNRKIVITPPDYPCPASYPLESAWYPSPERIATEAFRLLGRHITIDEQTESHVAAPTGGGPF